MSLSLFGYVIEPEEKKDIEFRFAKNFLSTTDQNEDISSFIIDDSINLSAHNLENNYLSSFGENNGLLPGDSNKKNQSIPLSEKTKINSTNEHSYIGKKGKSRKKKDKEYIRKDNVHQRIKRRFFNFYLINKLEEIRRKIKCKKYFIKFPSPFVCDADRNRNKAILNLTLREIFEKEELYKNEENVGLENYIHNLKVLKSEEIKNSEEFKNILNKTYSELYREYINSDEFKIVDINYLKNKGEDDEYIEKFENLAKTQIEFFVNFIKE